MINIKVDLNDTDSGKYPMALDISARSVLHILKMIGDGESNWNSNLDSNPNEIWRDYICPVYYFKFGETSDLFSFIIIIFLFSHRSLPNSTGDSTWIDRQFWLSCIKTVWSRSSPASCFFSGSDITWDGADLSCPYKKRLLCMCRYCFTWANHRVFHCLKRDGGSLKASSKWNILQNAAHTYCTILRGTTNAPFSE